MAGGLAVSAVVFEGSERRRVLVVRRPEEQEPEYPGMWGLPAATVSADETPESAVRRLGRQKLGVPLEPNGVLIEGSRADGSLSMVLFEARALGWPPRLERPKEADGVTYYTEWRWGEPEVLRPTADQGSLCCRLFFESGAARG